MNIEKNDTDIDVGSLVVLRICGFERLGHVLNLLPNDKLRMVMIDTIIRHAEGDRAYATFPKECVLKIADRNDIQRLIFDNLRSTYK